MSKETRFDDMVVDKATCKTSLSNYYNSIITGWNSEPKNESLLNHLATHLIRTSERCIETA